MTKKTIKGSVKWTLVALPVAGILGALLFPKDASATINGNNFKIDVSSAACSANADCTATIRLEATGAYHINDNYPYKYKAEAVDGVTYLGKDGAGPNVFSKAAGDFVKQAEKVGVMTVKYKAGKAGDFSLGGTYKFSVCSDANCQLESQQVGIPVKVK